MSYIKQFDPGGSLTYRSDFTHSLEQQMEKRDGEVYVFGDERIVLAVNVALVTGRPLLIYGAAGSGKSTLAASIARVLNRRYYEAVVTSRTNAQDLLWSFDVVRRLGDATAAAKVSFGGADDLLRYIQPGVLWWAFDPTTANVQGLRDLGGSSPLGQFSSDLSSPAVILIDEIDKADPDVPNNLLVPIGSLGFVVKETGVQITAKQIPLIIFTSNEERDLPAAFVRRCIVLRLPLPTKDQLVRIADAHFGTDQPNREMYGLLAEKTISLRTESLLPYQRPPSTAEFLDAVRACLKLGIGPASEHWAALMESVLAKPDSAELQR
jgi:MoxR-like ATPase